MISRKQEENAVLFTFSANPAEPPSEGPSAPPPGQAAEALPSPRPFKVRPRPPDHADQEIRIDNARHGGHPRHPMKKPLPALAVLALCIILAGCSSTGVPYNDAVDRIDSMLSTRASNNEISEIFNYVREPGSAKTTFRFNVREYDMSEMIPRSVRIRVKPRKNGRDSVVDVDARKAAFFITRSKRLENEWEQEVERALRQ